MFRFFFFFKQGRELQKSKEENRRLMTSVSVSDDSNKQEAVENLNDDGRKCQKCSFLYVLDSYRAYYTF